MPCYLAVLKDLGPANGSPLSFPLEGWTLTLDLPRAAPGLGPLLDGFDRLVAEAGGRVYLTKDARLRPEALQAMYPRLDEWRSIRDLADPERRWCSDLGPPNRAVVSEPSHRVLLLAAPRRSGSRSSGVSPRMVRRARTCGPRPGPASSRPPPARA